MLPRAGIACIRRSQISSSSVIPMIEIREPIAPHGCYTPGDPASEPPLPLNAAARTGSGRVLAGGGARGVAADRLEAIQPLPKRCCGSVMNSLDKAKAGDFAPALLPYVR